MQMISGVDIALWDIAGKAFGQPVHKLLGAKYRDTVAAYASTLFRPTPEGMQEAVAGYMERGFRAIKFGWGVFGTHLVPKGADFCGCPKCTKYVFGNAVGIIILSA